MRDARSIIGALTLFMLAGSHCLPLRGTEQVAVASALPVAARQSPGEVSRVITGLDRPAHFVAFSPDGQTLVSATTEARLTLWSVTRAERIRTFNLVGFNSLSCAFSPDGKTLAVAGYSADGNRVGVRILDIASGSESKPLEGDSLGLVPSLFSPAVAYSLDGKLLAASASRNANEIVMWDTAEGKRIKVIPIRVSSGRNNGAAQIIFSPNGRIMGSVGTSGAFLWDIATGRELKRLTGYRGYINTIAFSRDGRWLSGEGSYGVYRWQVATGRLLGLFTKPNRVMPASNEYTDTIGDRFEYAFRARTAAFDADSRVLACALLDFRGDRRRYGIEIWSLTTRRKIKTLEGHSDWVQSVAFSPDGRMLASVSDDATIRLWAFAR